LRRIQIDSPTETQRVGSCVVDDRCGVGPHEQLGAILGEFSNHGVAGRQRDAVLRCDRKPGAPDEGRQPVTTPQGFPLKGF
jgi:hypothetical protein